MKIILFLVLILFIVLVFASPKDKLSLKSKLVILFCGAALFLAAFIYNEKMQERQDQVQRLLEDFMQEKSIKCGEYEVDNKHFNYEYGTQSFVAKRGFSNLNGVIIPIQKCIKE
ncbi:hypothetical protein [Campylobacter fetus]|uniref:Integral membrane protein n=1 Tax=Campylobacter fetus subsp. testudinum TaxID=1507806 RepID=A0AAX0HAD1_CAMFE|nr:hypothetical protein [Campylobacter fetus]AGZ81489.1 putative membrane protein [Campylobacter fetus subsp. testudinum 03-427]AJB45236.1 hypothetical protein CR44_03155 [Campylobacter fetus subsp. testudinum]ALV64588.1 hypothetical membrane protein [Campylobacter fetus subsp. testudinum Sp3]AVK80905.1 hypothetical protein C6B32_03400 [Campylobacter fetus subsp. testudinum]EAI4322623.1 hypothetical protein [Campylobacter fetus]